ncbi:condensation domain-containing protein [Streptomyces zaomyceticus]|uniref:hypothetical protein n=1 Tax=Streptomyces zaomyceticus TaxID=68286 RepID=UPI00167BD4F5|nr:hypothetical protein [Streptomyces zaomyceticus]GHG35906.1 hypothetical protein GCM10018791_61700 [Streptomyces zaomyceticus]
MSAISEELRTEQFVLSLRGVLPYVYEHAWQSVLDGTTLTRTALRPGPDGRLRRALRPDARFRLQIVDWRATRAEVQDARLAERLAGESATGLPLDRAPLMCATLIRRSDLNWTFAWRYARELMDRRAGLRVLEEVAEAYAVLLRGGTPRRAATPPAGATARGATAAVATRAVGPSGSRPAGAVGPRPAGAVAR